jgi:hypothetical protein
MKGTELFLEQELNTSQLALRGWGWSRVSFNAEGELEQGACL